jgi:hypothetical protein
MIVDPVSDNLVDGYVSLRKLASDFLFDASKLLTAMREQIDAVNESEVAAPRNYMFVSELTRGFGHAQTAHHRFEFAATKIDSANNFRLDAALRGARGLRSRTRDRLAAIEKALQAEALKTAKETYAIDLRDAQIAVLASRRRLDEIVGQLLQADGSVLATIAPSEQFLGAVIRRELAEKAAADERGQIAQLQEIVDDLSTKRKAVAAGSVVELASIETSPAPHDLRRRVELSGAAASIALVSILLGQWWLARRT